MAAVRRWNLNEAEGRYAMTNVAESLIDLHFGMKRTDGRQVPVGRFRLNLELLSRTGFVTKRQVGSSAVYDVQIYRLRDGSFVLGVRQDQTTPLAQYAAR